MKEDGTRLKSGSVRAPTGLCTGCVRFTGNFCGRIKSVSRERKRKEQFNKIRKKLVCVLVKRHILHFFHDYFI